METTETTTDTPTDTTTGGEVVTVERLNTTLARFTRWEREIEHRSEELEAAERAYDQARASLKEAGDDLAELVKRASKQGGVR